MFWIRSSALALLLLGASSAMAETLVVRSTGPSSRAYPPGKAIPDNGRIVLKANDSVVILDERGTRTLKGPGTFSPARASATSESRSTFTALLSQRSERRARIGAVRGTPPAAAADTRPANIWFADIARDATVCVVDPAQLMLWRADPAQPAVRTLTAADGKSWAISWQAGQSMIAWPEAAPITPDTVYRLTQDGAAVAGGVRFAMLERLPEGVEPLAVELMKHDCQPQLDLLIAVTGGNE